MKILHVIPNLLKGGAERIALDICNEIHTNTEHEVLLITFQPENAYSFLTETITWKVIPSDVIPSISGKAQINVSKLQKTINDFQPDIIHAHLFKSIIVVSQLNYTKARYFIHFHDNMHQLENFSAKRSFDKGMWTNLYEKRMILQSFKGKQVSAITISAETNRYAKQVLPNSIQTHKVLNAIDRNRFLSDVKETGSNRLVMIGSLVDKKNQILAIHVAEELKSRAIDVVLDLIGDGPNMKQLERYIADNDLHNQVTLHGSIDQPEDILREASIYLHTAKIEAFGLVLIEAMASGLPIVCTNGGGNKDLILEGENGFLINEFSAKLLADKVEDLIKSPKKRMEMGLNAQAFSEKFDISNYVKTLIALYTKK